MNKQTERPNEIVSESSANQLSVFKGGHGLPVTFWVWGVMGSFFLGVIISAVVSISEALPSLVICATGFEFYSIFVVIATWRASGLFQGAPHWGVLAKVFSIFWLGLLSFAYLYFVAMISSPYPNH